MLIKSLTKVIGHVNKDLWLGYVNKTSNLRKIGHVNKNLWSGYVN